MICQGNKEQPFLNSVTNENDQILITTVIPEEAEIIAVGSPDGDLCFQVGRDEHGTIQRLELFSDAGVVADLQKKSYPLKLLKECLIREQLSSKWPRVIANFKRYHSFLRVHERILVYNKVPVLECSMITEISLVLHHLQFNIVLDARLGGSTSPTVNLF